MPKRVAHAIHIAGLGTDKDYADGTLYVEPAGAELADGDVADYAIVVGLDPRSTSGVGYHVNPVKRGAEGVASSAFDFRMPARDDLFETFLHVQHTTSIGLSAALQPATADVELDLSSSPLSPGSLEDTVVWCQKEAILLGSYNSGNGKFETSTRGYYGSRQADHAKNVNVYESHLPDWDRRRVVLYEIDLDRLTLAQVWPGYIDLSEQSDLRSTKTGAGIVIPAADTTAHNEAVSVRHEPLHPESGVRALQVSTRESLGDRGEYSGRTSITWHVEKPQTASAQYSHDTGIAWRVGDTLCLQKGGVYARQGVLGSPRPAGPSGTTFEPADLENDPHEVLLIARELDDGSGPVFANPVSSSRELDGQPGSYGSVQIADPAIYPYHPLAIGMALELSTARADTVPEEFDVLQAPDWALDRRELYADGIIERAHEIIQRTSYLRIDQLVLGWPRDPVALIEQIDRYLYHPFGLFRVLDDQGNPTIEHFRLADAKDLLDAQTGAFGNPVPAIPDPDGAGLLDLRTGQGSTVDVVEILYDGLPWREPKSIYYRPTEGQQVEKSQYQGDPEFTLDLSTIKDRSTAVRMAERIGVLQSTQIPQFSIRAEAPDVTGASYDGGGFISLDDLPLKKRWLLDVGGTRVNVISQVARFAVMLQGWRYYMGNRTYRLDGLLTNFVGQQSVQLRCPAAHVLDVTTDGNGDVTAVWVSPTSAFGAAGTDADEHAAGDDVRFYTENLALRGAAPTVEIAAIASSTATTPGTGETAYKIDLDTAMSGADKPQEDDFMRFADYGQYDNPGHGGDYLTGYGRIYAWLADAAGTLGAAEDDEAIYG